MNTYSLAYLHRSELAEYQKYRVYCEYMDKPNLQSLIGEISWTKNLVIFGRCKDDLERSLRVVGDSLNRGYGNEDNHHRFDIDQMKLR